MMPAYSLNPVCKERGEVDERGGCLESGDSLLLHEFFIKKTKTFIMLCSLFKFSKFAPILLEEAETHIFNIHIG